MVCMNKRTKRPIEVVDDDDDDDEEEADRDDDGGVTGPIIELPESPAPPSPKDEAEGEGDADTPNVEDLKDEDGEDGGGGGRVNSRSAETSNPVRESLARPTAQNPLVIQPRKPIRTHQASPLASGHSIRRFAFVP